MPKKKPRAKTLRGSAVVKFIADRKKTLSTIDLDPEIRHLATQVLDAVATNVETWELDRSDLPSLPNKPAFSLLANGHAYSNIPLPKAQRHRFGGDYQKRKRWPGSGMAAWAHYVAHVNDVIHELTSPAANPSPGRSAMGLAEIDALVGNMDVAMIDVSEAFFNSSIVADTIASPEALQQLRSSFNVILGYLDEVSRSQVSTLDKPTLMGFRSICLKSVQERKKAIRTVNGYLAAARRVLKWCVDLLDYDIPPSYETLLRDIGRKDLSRGSRTGKTIGVWETVAMPVEPLRAILREAQKDDFEFALMMCSFNLAAGASDLSELCFWDHSSANPTPEVDMGRKLFITRRGKTGIPRWVTVSDRNELVIRMMDRTHQALTAWLEKRKQLIHDLSGNKALAERIAQAKQIRRMYEQQGYTQDEISKRLKIPQRTVSDLLKKFADPKTQCQKLAMDGYSQKDITALTGLSKSSVSYHLKNYDANSRQRNGHNRHIIVKPDENRVFFIPSNGRPLVNANGAGDYVETVFSRLCKRAGIIREADILSDEKLKPPIGTFVLPKHNGHYIIRRTAATVAGMLGNVPERFLQTFMGHKDPQTTRRYVHNPPSDYVGERMSHDYNIKLTPTTDPVEAISAFLDHVLN